MKTKGIIGTLGILLVASLAGNAWLGATLRTYRYNVYQGWFTYFEEGTPVYPITGFSSTDLKQIVEQVEATDVNRPEDKCIMRFEILDKYTVEVIIGQQNGPLAGGGRIFRFKLTPSGWTLDRSQSSFWVS